MRRALQKSPEPTTTFSLVQYDSSPFNSAQHPEFRAGTPLSMLPTLMWRPWAHCTQQALNNEHLYSLSCWFSLSWGPALADSAATKSIRLKQPTHSGGGEGLAGGQPPTQRVTDYS